MNADLNIIVAIKCLVYNHEPYLRDCLEGLVMQKTNFRFVAIVHDDCSLDSSADIIREYSEKYPDIIKPIYETENQYSKPDDSLDRIINAAFDATGAKYIALCEGDDYWTDPYKLQKQVDFMETHPECSVTFHRCWHFNTYTNQWSDDGLEKYIIYNEPTEISIPQFFKHWCTQPLTMMYRRCSYDTSIRANYKHFWDTYFIYHLLCAGRGYLLPFVGGVYVIHANGVSGGLKTNVQRCHFALISADELFSVNRNDPYVRKNWSDIVMWSLQTYWDAGRKDLYMQLIWNEYKHFPMALTRILLKRLKSRIGKFIKNEITMRILYLCK